MSDLSYEALVALAQRVVTENIAAGRKVALAESCTGGLVCAAITDIPGSSAVLDRGFVTYSNEAKQEMLGVKPAIIDTLGAVSPATAPGVRAGDAAGAVPGAVGVFTAFASMQAMRVRPARPARPESPPAPGSRRAGSW